MEATLAPIITRHDGNSLWIIKVVSYGKTDMKNTIALEASVA